MPDMRIRNARLQLTPEEAARLRAIVPAEDIRARRRPLWLIVPVVLLVGLTVAVGLALYFGVISPAWIASVRQEAAWLVAVGARQAMAIWEFLRSFLA
jgi:type VI protein secretion system component VasF